MVTCVTQVNKITGVFALSFSLLFFSSACGDNHTTESPEQPPSLVFGILPAQSTVSLFHRFAPLRDYLRNDIQREVSLQTAKNLSEFIKRTAQRQYDIVFTAPHLALKAVDMGNYEVAVTSVKPLSAVLITADSSEVHDIEQLAGQTIAIPPQQAIVSLLGRQYLREQGLQGENQATFKIFRTHNAASSAALAGETEAAIVSNYIFSGLVSGGAAVRKLGETPGFPGIGILVATDLDDNLKMRIKNALIKMQHHPDGNLVLKQIAQPGYRESDASEFEILRPYADELKMQ